MTNAATLMSMDGTDPASWDPKLDGLLAAPDNHRLLYEDESVRVLSVRIAPGETEEPHHHRWPSVFVIELDAFEDARLQRQGRRNPLAYSG